ncbi:hypothetical protein H6P81_012020 [Aristolochia fimbriata]|uniref:F-box protein n=1 Tax=Aristolochia fimbriata TaxID=158543 RepID=A0AAV7EDW1_ARIFI|nr:hypothetical protein H6P81_012020 [Aristolochia fimbriata]
MEKAKVDREESGSELQRRPWGQMECNLLILIFQKLAMISDVLGVAQVCSEWRKAAPYTRFFISDNQLNLRYYDSVSFKQRAIYFILLRKSLETQNLNDLVFSFGSTLPGELLIYIAQRSSTTLKSLYLTENSLTRLTPSYIPKIIPHWKNLTSLDAAAWTASTMEQLINVVGLHCRKLTELRLYGIIETPEAEKIVASFPELRSLDLSCCYFSEPALGIIMEGVKNLKRMNLCHTVCWEKDMNKFRTKAPWEEEAKAEIKKELLDKLTALEDFQYCYSACALCHATSFGRFEIVKAKETKY